MTNKSSSTYNIVTSAWFNCSSQHDSTYSKQQQRKLEIKLPPTWNKRTCSRSIVLQDRDFNNKTGYCAASPRTAPHTRSDKRD